MLLKKLAAQTAIYGISSIVVRMLNYMMTPYFTYVVFTRAEYGVMVDLYALIPFLLIVLTMGMESGYFRFAAKAETPEAKKQVFSTTWSLVSIVSIVFLCVILLFNNSIADALRYSDRVYLVWMTAVIVVLDAIAAIPFAKLREEGKAVRYVVIRSLSVVINIVLCVGFYSLLPRLAGEGGVLQGWYDESFGVGYYLVSNIIASLITLLLLMRGCSFTRQFVDRKLLRALFLFSMPLLLSGIAGTANEFIDRQMIKYLMPADVSMDALGVYGAVVKIGVLMTLFTQMYRLAAEPFFLSNFKKEDFVRTNAEALKFFMIVSVVIFLGIMYFIPLFQMIIGRSFREGLYILPVVLVSNMLSGVVLNLSFWYKQTGRTKFALYVTCTGLLFTVVFNVMLVPTLGYFGSALARLICEFTMVALSYYLNRRFFPTPYDLRRIGLYLLLGAMLYGVGFLTAYLSEIPKYLCNLALLTGFILFALRRERIDVVALVRSMVKR